MDNLKVLVIGESDSVGGLVSKILSRKGFDVTVVDACFRPEKIHAELSRKKYDMILPTNNFLSPGQIQSLIPEVKTKYPAVKIIVLSGFNTPEFVRDLKEQGIDDFLSMPFSPDDLVEKVISIFDQENKIKEAQKKLNWATLSCRKEFRCEVTGCDRHNYRVRFSKEERLIAIESIPRKEIDDLKLRGKNSPSLKELFGWVEQVVEGRGKS